ncbi:hypothetical protein JPSP56_22730 [Staphylococcus pseudintermedius]
MLLDILCRNKKTFAILLLSMALLSLVYYFTPFFNVMFLKAMCQAKIKIFFKKFQKSLLKEN